MSPVEAVRTAQTVVVAASVVILVLAAGFTLYRLTKGPTNLDRIIASDLMVGIAVGAFALQVVLSDDETTLPIMLVISFVGFIGAVSMARFVHDQRMMVPRDVRRSRRRGDGGRPIVRGERPAGTETSGERTEASGTFGAPEARGAFESLDASAGRTDAGDDA